MFQSIPNEVIIVGVIVLLIAAILAFKKSYDSEFRDITLRMPEVLRTNLLYGYYCSLIGQYEETKDHINLFWHSNFYDADEFIRILKETDCKIVLDLAPFISVKSIITVSPPQDPNSDYAVAVQASVVKLILNPEAEKDLREVFTKLRDHGVLHKITYLYPIDEPEFSVKDEAEFRKMVYACKSVAAEFEELHASKFVIIHGSHKDFWCIPDFDIHAVDAYGEKSQVLTIGEHARLVKQLMPGQKTFLVPGCAFGQIPEPFMAYAHLNPEEVEAVIPFLWFDDPEHKDVEYTGLVARDEKFKQRWINAGKSCIAQ